MRVARIENGLVADIWEVSSLNCFGDLYTLIEAPDDVIIGTVYADNKFTIIKNTSIDVDYSKKILELSIRKIRNDLILQTDWTQLLDVPQTTIDKWIPYRQALRDITLQVGFPIDVIWPIQPV